jgi:hypothetical protein
VELEVLVVLDEDEVEDVEALLVTAGLEDGELVVE